MNGIYIKNRLGNCQLICFFRDIGIIELPNNYEKYVVAIGISITEKRWERGLYCLDFKEAAGIFNEILKDMYNASFKV